MDDLANQEQTKYDRIWTTFPEYRQDSPADYLTPIFLLFFQDQIQKGETVIDFGCGPGRSAIPLLEAGLKVHLVDICDNCLDPEIFLYQMQSKIHFTQSCLWSLTSELKPAEWGICFDVMEHLPEKTVDSALKQMAQRLKRGALFSIFLNADRFGQTVGEKLHLTLQSATWWISKLEAHFSIYKELLKNDTTLVVAVTAK